MERFHPSGATLPRALGASALALAAILCAGCAPEKLSDTDKARLIKEKRLEARDLLAKFRASDGQDLDSLKRYVEVQKETTDIAPETCPKCWASYGEGLSFIGYYYWNLYNDAIEDLDKAGPEEEPGLKAKTVKLKRLWVKYFEDSNRAYKAHFSSGDVSVVHPFSYERVMRHNELLGNYEMAIYYLEKCLESYPLVRDMDGPTRERFETLRRLYKREAARQKEDQAQGKVRGAPDRPLTGRPSPKAKVPVESPEPEE
jgi:tetratricopeptide (TPR) repeat protein